GTGRGGELGEEVAARSAPRRGEGRGRRVPEAEAVMVLGGGHEVAGTGAGGEARDPRGGVPTRMPVVGEVLVAVADPVEPLVAVLRGAAVDAHRVRVPLGVLVAGVGGLGRDVTAVEHIGPGRDRVQAPVHEDPELRVAVPVRDGGVGVGARGGGVGRAMAVIEADHGGSPYPVSSRNRETISRRMAPVVSQMSVLCCGSSARAKNCTLSPSSRVGTPTGSLKPPDPVEKQAVPRSPMSTRDPSKAVAETMREEGAAGRSRSGAPSRASRSRAVAGPVVRWAPVSRCRCA